MKKLILGLAVMLSFTAVAQDGKMGKGKGMKHDSTHVKFTPEQRAQKSVDKLDQTVTLTADQKTQVYNLALSRAQKVDAIRTKYKGQPAQKETAKAEIKAAHKEYRQAVKAILTPEQLAKLKEKRKEHKGNHEGKGGKGGKNPKPKTDTNISEEDVDELIPSEE